VSDGSEALTSLRRRLRARAPSPSPASTRGVGRAAVALVLRQGEPGLELLLIKRAESGHDPWSGHVALPGGREAPSDISLEATALRETLEETGLDLARDGEVLGRLDDLSPRGGPAPVVVRPYVVALHGDAPLVLSDEVATAFWVPVEVLAAPGAVKESVVQIRGGELRVNSFRHGDHVIWGLTERILQQLLSELAVSTFP
jgi:8-oxo-dGTP pyrophosphatase MutT (NUDIX family)